MLKKLIVLLSLVIIPIAFAASMANSTEINNITENLNKGLTNMANPIVNCIYNCTRGEGLCTENCPCGKGINCRMNGYYNNSINSTATYPCGYNGENCIYDSEMHHYGRMHGMGHGGMYRGACGGPRFAMTTE